MAKKVESNDEVALPPEINLELPTRKDIGKTYYEWSSNEIQTQLPTDVVLITVKDHEFDSCYSYMKLRQVQQSWCDKVGMMDFGEFGEKGVRVALIRSEGGSVSSVLVVKNAIEILDPKVVLFVGNCATINPAKANLGDVVISAKLATFANKEITPDGTEKLCGNKVKISPKMSKLILAASDGWMPPLKNPDELKVKIHRDAVLLSGPEVVHNRARCEELLRSFPDAIALEIDGEGCLAQGKLGKRGWNDIRVSLNQKCLDKLKAWKRRGNTGIPEQNHQ